MLSSWPTMGSNNFLLNTLILTEMGPKPPASHIQGSQHEKPFISASRGCLVTPNGQS